MRSLKNFSAFLFLLLVVFSQACNKEDVDDDNQNPPPDTTTNPPPDTTQQWNVPWPQWMFYHWVWEDESTQQSAQQLVDDYIAHDIPVGAIIIDSPWETDYNTFDWDLSLYPDPQGMVNYFHSKDVRVFIWITAIINTNVQPLYDDAKALNYFMKSSATSANPAVVNWWKGNGSAIDFWNPNAVAWWKTLMDKTLNLGIDGWKCDGADYNTFLSGATYSPGKGGTVSRMEYSHAYYRLFHDYTRQKNGNDCVNTLRPIDNYGLGIGGDLVAFGPKDITWAAWVGDQDATFPGLRAALDNMYHSSAYGYIAYGSDIGGYREDNSFPQSRSKELFIRWAQMGAFSPIMENGGGGEHRPWMFDQQTEDIYRKLVKLRHGCLIPYLMTSSEKAWNEGKSMMTFFNKTDYSYLLGEDIFVTPFLQAGTTITVNFPTGSNWIYMYDESKVYTGGASENLNISYDEFPVFFREGSSLVDIIDFNSIQ